MKKTVRVIAAAVIGTVCIFGAQSAAYAASAAKTDAAGVATATTSANAAPAAAAKSTSALSDAADTNAPDLKFTPDGGGYYIYCNNNEFIRRRDLSDTSNPNPEYLMNKRKIHTLFFTYKPYRADKTGKRGGHRGHKMERIFRGGNRQPLGGQGVRF